MLPLYYQGLQTFLLIVDPNTYFCLPMALILGIETATEVCSVALSKNGKCLAEHNNFEGNSHAAQLHVMVDKLLQEAGFTLNDLQAIAVSKGPGSYTGLRVGVSAAKGYAFALQIPLIAVSSLDGLSEQAAKQITEPKALLVPMIDARRMEVYTCVSEMNGKEINPVSAQIINEASFLNLLGSNQMYFFGNGSEKCQAIINHENAVFMPNIVCRAKGLMPLAEIAFQNNAFENTAYFEPFYLKDFVSTNPKKK